jgi:hypothetical protein
MMKSLIEYGATPRIEYGAVSRIESGHVRIESNRVVIESTIFPRRCGLGGNCNICKFRKHCVNH